MLRGFRAFPDGLSFASFFSWRSMSIAVPSFPFLSAAIKLIQPSVRDRLNSPRLCLQRHRFSNPPLSQTTGRRSERDRSVHYFPFPSLPTSSIHPSSPHPQDFRTRFTILFDNHPTPIRMFDKHIKRSSRAQGCPNAFTDRIEIF